MHNITQCYLNHALLQIIADESAIACYKNVKKKKNRWSKHDGSVENILDCYKQKSLYVHSMRAWFLCVVRNFPLDRATFHVNLGPSNSR